MKVIGSVKEDLIIEKRVSLTPETIKKFASLKFSVLIESKYGEHLGVKDEVYIDSGATICNSAKEVYEKSDIILKVNSPQQKEIHLMKNGIILIGQIDVLRDREIINELVKKKINVFSLNLLPRITRAQSMDVLSSQANLAGYKAVIDSVKEFEKAVPMMMTAAGTITPARILVIGAGVAGLQAIATAKRLGAIVFATDVRTVAKEQVESLGGKFLLVEGAENMETTEGYAKEADENFKKKQTELLKKSIKNSDIVICTALVPGKKAPRIISEEMIKSMKSGSVIYDLAVSQGGNSAFSEPDKVTLVNGVKIMGSKNILNSLALSASSLYAKNLFNFTNNLYSKDKKDIYINKEDEIIKKTLINKGM
tara:strand:+ start:197 stop:1297 length:1101 start_codon:yes stop_codon:yes gene_type:complete